STLYERSLETDHPMTEQINALFEQVSDAFLTMTLALMTDGVLPELNGHNGLVVFRQGHVAEFELRDHYTVRSFPEWLTA
ncbi:siderophore biosynthesis protein SbnC, partial [Staphylococcus pseudintermedius]